MTTSIPNYLQGSSVTNSAGTLSAYPSQPGATLTNQQMGVDANGNWNIKLYNQQMAQQQQQAGTGGSIPMTTSDPWLSLEEMRAETDAMKTMESGFGQSSGGGGGGGGGGFGGGTASSGGSGLNLSGINGGAGAANGGNPAFTNSSMPTSPMIGYQNPGQAGMTGQPGVLQMQQANPQAALDQYKNTPGYQLLNAPGAYQQSPGYQYAMDQAMGQVQGAASAKGMLESGAVLKNMQQTASGLAQQDYGNWWNRQNQLYGDYQNRLQGLAGGPTGSADAMTAGANGAQANLQTGSNLGSLFGNQGTAGMGGIINTGAAQSGNMINAGQQQAQVGAANQSTQLAGATLAAKGLF